MLALKKKTKNKNKTKSKSFWVHGPKFGPLIFFLSEIEIIFCFFVFYMEQLLI